MKRYQVLNTTRLRNTTNGNPRYEFELRGEGGDVFKARTKGDSMFVYGLRSNLEWMDAAIHMTQRGFVIINASNA